MSNQTTNTDVVVSTLPSSAEIAMAISNGMKVTIGDTVTEGDIANRIAGATTLEDIFGGGELAHVKDFLGTTLNVLAIEGARNSDFEGGVGIFLIVKVADPDGEIFSMSVGIADGVQKLVKLQELGLLPCKVAFEQSTKATRSGFYPINLVLREESPLPA